MAVFLDAFDRACLLALRSLLRLAVAIDDLRRALPRRVRRWHGSIHRVYQQWLARHGFRRAPPPPASIPRRRRRAWNRTPDHLEAELVRLHVEQPLLGAGQLRWLCERVLGFLPARETVRRILIRRRDLVAALEQQRRRRRRRIHVPRPRLLWGADLTLVWVLGIFPVWMLGIVDYHGSRIVALERMPWWPTAGQIAHVFESAFESHGAPERLLTDRGPIFRAIVVQRQLAAAGVRHVLTRPAHPWTNGRIERIFGTYKRTTRSVVWLFASIGQVDRFAADFVRWYNTARPHASWAGRTPDEVFFGRPKQFAERPRSVSYFDGRMTWYEFAEPCPSIGKTGAASVVAL